MKRRIFTLILMLAAITTFAQTVVTVSGNVFNQANGNPVPNYEVYISADSSMNANGFYYSNQVFTDMNGYFIDNILTDSFPAGYYSTGTLTVRVYDCNNWHFDNPVTFSTGVYNLTTSFSICIPVINPCAANFSSYADSTLNTVNFTDNSGGNINSWLWNFGDSTTSTLQNPVHTFSNSGNFNVCLTVSDLDSNGIVICTDTYCENTGVGICSASFYAYADSVNNTLDFYDYSSGTVNAWLWDFGDGTTSTLQNPTHHYANGGYFNVCLTISHMVNGSAICTDTYCQNTAVNVPTTPDYYCDADFYFSESNPGTFAFNDYSFANQDGIDVITGWTWNFGDGTTSNMQYPTHTYLLPGVYSVTLTIFTAEGCSSFLAMDVDAGNSNIGTCHADFEVYIDYNQPFTFYFEEASLSEDPSQVIASALWDFGDGTTSTTLGSPTHTFIQGVYHICHTITTTTGCTSTYCENLTVDSACYIYVFATAIINETTAGSANGSISLSVIGTPPFVYNWSNGATSQTINGLSAGYYNVWVNDANGCQTWATFDVLVNADSLNWHYNDTLISNVVDTCFNFQPASASIYSYTFNGIDSVTITWIVFDITGTLHGFTTNTYLYDSTGYYVVLLSVNCDSSKTQLHNFYGKLYIRGKITGIAPSDGKGENINLYPIPVTDKLNLSFNLPNAQPVIINILNVTGQVIHSEKLYYSGGQSVLTVNTSSLAGGMYFVQMNYSGKSKMLKFVK